MSDEQMMAPKRRSSVEVYAPSVNRRRPTQMTTETMQREGRGLSRKGEQDLPVPDFYKSQFFVDSLPPEALVRIDEIRAIVAAYDDEISRMVREDKIVDLGEGRFCEGDISDKEYELLGWARGQIGEYVESAIKARLFGHNEEKSQILERAKDLVTPTAAIRRLAQRYPGKREIVIEYPNVPARDVEELKRRLDEG